MMLAALEICLHRLRHRVFVYVLLYNEPHWDHKGQEKTRYSNTTCIVHVLSVSLLLKPAACSLHAGPLPQYFHQEQHLAGRQPWLTHVHVYRSNAANHCQRNAHSVQTAAYTLQMQLINMRSPTSNCVFQQLGPTTCSKVALTRTLPCG